MMMHKTILMLVALAGCDKLKSEPTPTPVTASAPSQVVTAADPAIAMPPPPQTTASVVAPGQWPAYLPDYPGATVTKKSKDLESLETKDAPDKVVAFYKDKLKAAGFPPGAWATLGASKDQATVMTASKGSEMVQVTVTPIQGTTKISLSIL
jgi:hypothetical protein